MLLARSFVFAVSLEVAAYGPGQAGVQMADRSAMKLAALGVPQPVARS